MERSAQERFSATASLSVFGAARARIAAIFPHHSKRSGGPTKDTGQVVKAP
jgi:hypothetical protein